MGVVLGPAPIKNCKVDGKMSYRCKLEVETEWRREVNYKSYDDAIDAVHRGDLKLYYIGNLPELIDYGYRRRIYVQMVSSKYEALEGFRGTTARQAEQWIKWFSKGLNRHWP